MEINQSICDLDDKFDNNNKGIDDIKMDTQQVNRMIKDF